ncbi:hypothetical protein HK096_001439, partial [Nowakowskiella sp. JEL0078]
MSLAVPSRRMTTATVRRGGYGLATRRKGMQTSSSVVNMEELYERWVLRCVLFRILNVDLDVHPLLPAANSPEAEQSKILGDDIYLSKKALNHFQMILSMQLKALSG